MSQVSIFYEVYPISSIHDEKAIKYVLDEVSGVKHVSVNIEDRKVVVVFDSTGCSEYDIEKKLLNLGYEISLLKKDIVIH